MINDHALLKASKELISKVITNPQIRLVQSDGRIAYLTKDGFAVLDNQGRVITAWSKVDFQADILNILALLK